MPFSPNLGAAMLAIVLIGPVRWADAADADAPYLRLENHTSAHLDNIRLTSGEKFTERDGKLRATDRERGSGLGPGLYTYEISISPVSLGANVHATLGGREVVFRCHTPIELRPRKGSITCVLTEEGGAFLAEYVPTPFPNSLDALENVAAGPGQIVILGTVKRPGLFDVPNGEKLTLEQALLLAGGLHHGDWINSPTASPRGIQLHRLVNGEKKTFKLDASNIRGKRGKGLDFPVLPGDKIYVPYLF